MGVNNHKARYRNYRLICHIKLRVITLKIKKWARLDFEILTEIRTPAYQSIKIISKFPCISFSAIYNMLQITVNICLKLFHIIQILVGFAF